MQIGNSFLEQNKGATMKKKALILALSLLSAPAFASDLGYAVTTGGTVWRNSSGECWRGGPAGPTPPLVECGDAVAVAEEVTVESADDKVVIENETAIVSEKAAAVATTSIVLSDVRFANNSAELPQDYMDELDVIVQGVKDDPTVKGLAVTGYTDSNGPAAYNLDLSQRRAKSVGDYLVAEGVGVEVTTQGKGEEDPVADNATSEGRAKNRRVVIDVIR